MFGVVLAQRIKPTVVFFDCGQSCVPGIWAVLELTFDPHEVSA
jgi:hypothetical protein